MGFNQLQDCFWKDQYIESLERNECLVYIFLLTAPENNIIGLYSITERNIAYYCRLDKSEVHPIMEKFVNDGKIAFDGQVVWLKNRHEYSNWQTNKNQITFANNKLTEPLIVNSSVAKEFSEFFSSVLQYQPNTNKKVSENIPETNNTPLECYPDTIEIPSETTSNTLQIPSEVLKDKRLNIKDKTFNKNTIQELKEFNGKIFNADSQNCEPQNNQNVPGNVVQLPVFEKSKQQPEHNVPISANNQQKTKNEKPKLSPDDDAFWNVFKHKKTLAIAFYKATGLYPMTGDFGHWQKDLDRFIEAGITVEVMEQAIKKIQYEGKIQYKTPGSVFSTARWLMTQPKIAPTRQKEESWTERAERIAAEMNNFDDFGVLQLETALPEGNVIDL